MPRSRYSKFVKATKGFTSDEEPESDSTFPSGPESRSTTSDESSQRYSTSRLESKKRYEDTCESDAEVPSGSEALFTTSDKPLKIPLPSRSSQIRTGFSSSPSSTGTKKKAGNVKNPRVKGGRVRSSPLLAEARRRDDTEVSDDRNSNFRASATTETLETETKSSAKDSKSKSKKHTKNPSRQPIPTAGASVSDPRSRHSSTSSLNLSTGSHHDDSNISEYSSHETSADGGI